MDWRWLMILLTAVYCPKVFASKEVTTQINTKKLIHYLPDRFLSMTIDPFTILAAGPLSSESMNMAKALSPGLVRIGGKGTNILKFGKEFMKDDNTITEIQWRSVNNFVKDAGLEMILSLNPTSRLNGGWDSSNSVDLIAFSEKEGFDVAWQFGYDQKSVNASGNEVGKNLVKLRNILDALPKYSKTAIFAPDVQSSQKSCEMLFLKDMIDQSKDIIQAIIMQPQFNDDFEDSESKIRNMMTNLDTYIWNKNDIKSKKPFWIAEPNPSSGTFHDSMILMKRLGSAAKLGCQVFLRQPGVIALKKPTPEFWTSVLYKNLVGRGVLEAQIVSNNGSGVNIYSHCNPTISKDKSVLDSDINYEVTAVTVFGVNESPDEIKINLMAGSKDEDIHMYVLTSGKQSDRHEHPEPTLLNGEKLTLTPSGELPIISPKILQPKGNTVQIPPLSIFFLVLPNIKVRSCTASPLIMKHQTNAELTKLITSDKDLEKTLYESANNDKLMKFSKRQISQTNIEPISKRLENVHEKYRTLSKSLLDRLPRRLETIRRRHAQKDEEDVPVKYITYNDNSWLSKLKETVSNIGTKQEEQQQNTSIQKINEQKLEKFAPLKLAMTGTNKNNMDDEKVALRLKRSSTVNPNDKQTIEITKLPENVKEKLKVVQVTFTNLDDPEVLSGIPDSEQKTKQIIPRHIVLDKDDLENDKVFTEVTPVLIEDSKSSEEIDKELTSSEEKELIESKALLEEDEGGNESKSNEETAEEDEDLRTIDHIQKIKPNKEELKPSVATEELFTSPKEKAINTILSDIITKENKEQPPIVTVIEQQNKDESKNEQIVKDESKKDIDRLTEDLLSKTVITDTSKDLQNTDSITLPTILEEEIANADKGIIKPKVLRQVNDAAISQQTNTDEHVIVERLPGYNSDENNSEKQQINSTKLQEKNSLLNIPLIVKDLKLTPEAIFDDHKERMDAIKEKLIETSEKLRATIKDENIWNTIKQREEELRNIFRKFDKRETNFSPYEGRRGIQFVTSLPRHDDSLYGYQLDEIKSRPRRRLTQSAKLTKSDYYDSPTYYRENGQQNTEQEKPLYELRKSDNQYIFPLDSKTQGIVYNNKIYPAKLFGVVDVPNQQQLQQQQTVNYDKDLTYKMKSDEPAYLERNYKYERYPAEYAEDGGYQNGYPLPDEQTKKLSTGYAMKEEESQPYIPVVILSETDKQYYPKIKSDRIRRSINENRMNRFKRSPLINPALMNDLKYRYKLNSEIEKNKIDNENNSLMNLNESNEHEVCKEIGTSKESIIEQNDKTLTETNNKNKVKRHNNDESNDETKENHDENEKGTTHHIISMITDKFKNLIGYVHRIFHWDNQ